VVLDLNLLLKEAISRLIFRAGKDPLLTKVLLDFALEKIEDDKSWDVEHDLFEIGKLLFEENHKKHIEKYANKSVTDFLDLRDLITSKIVRLELQMKKEATNLITLLVAFFQSSCLKSLMGILI